MCLKRSANRNWQVWKNDAKKRFRSERTAKKPNHKRSWSDSKTWLNNRRPIVLRPSPKRSIRTPSRRDFKWLNMKNKGLPHHNPIRSGYMNNSLIFLKRLLEKFDQMAKDHETAKEKNDALEQSLIQVSDI